MVNRNKKTAWRKQNGPAMGQREGHSFAEAPAHHIRLACALLGLFAAGLIVRFWLISQFGIEVPNNDQWHVDVLGIYKPVLEGHFDWRFLFASWQEHRPVFQKLYDLLMFVTLGHFDNAMQCRVAAVLWCAVACVFFHLLIKHKPEARWPLLGVGLAVLALPFGYENTFNSFQPETYFCVVATTAAAWLFAGGRFWRGCIVSIIGIGGLASGFAAVPAFALLLLADRVSKVEPRNRKGFLLKLVIIALVCTVGFLLRGQAPGQEVHKAHNAGQFVTALLRYLAWPSLLLPCAALVNIAPVVMLWWLRFLGRTKDTFPERLAIVLFGIFLIQAVLTAAMRANGHSLVISRYQDQFAPMLVASVLALYELRAKVSWNGALAGAWATAAFIGMFSLNDFVIHDSMHYQRLANHNQLTALRFAYLNPNAVDKIPSQVWPAVDLTETSLMPELSGMVADTNLMKTIPALWSADHPQKVQLLSARK